MYPVAKIAPDVKDFTRTNNLRSGFRAAMIPENIDRQMPITLVMRIKTMAMSFTFTDPDLLRQVPAEFVGHSCEVKDAEVERMTKTGKRTRTTKITKTIT